MSQNETKMICAQRSIPGNLINSTDDFLEFKYINNWHITKCIFKM